ncbi:MAG: sensor domain-containing diguanylate cyclase, partial [Chloroflexi bacterium]|nr:sensor domain-containing diguanylate cyclase [Chloroflexota bacterium]
LSSVDGPPADGAAVTGALLPALSSCGRLLPDPLPDLGEPYHVVPLVAKGRVLGSFALVGTAGLRNDDDGRHLLLLVGREMGIAIENARLYQEAIEKAEREAFLTEVSGLLNGPGRGDRALPQVLEAFRLATKSEEVMLVTLPEESRDVVIAGISIREGAEPRLDRMARSLTRQVADRHRPLILGAGGEAPLSDRLVDDGVTTLAVAPIYLRRGDSHDPSLSHLAEHEPVRPAPTLTGALVVVGTDGEWRNDETMLIERVADILARRIQADEFVAVQQQRIRELTGLAEVARTMQSGADDERLYHGFAASLRRLMRYEALYIARVDDSMQLVGVPSFGQSGRAMPSPPFTATDVAHPWFSIRTPLLWMSGSDPGPGFLPDDSRYAVVVPLRPKGQMLGLAIVVVPRAVRADQLPIVEQAVEQLALALDGATLYQQATARASHIQALSNLARIVASVVNLREAFAAFSEEVRWLIPFDRAVMFLVDEGQQSVEPYAMYPDGILRPEPTPLVGSLAGVAVAAGTAVSLRRDDPRYAALDWDSVGPGVTEMAAVPIRHGGRTSAVFALVTDATEAYGIGDMDALDEVAGLLAVTIDRIRLFEQADYSAKHDLLTDLPNYRFLQERFQALRDRAGAPDEGGEPPRVAVLVVDMDNLKVFNDTLGHEVGDRVIREVGRILRESCRTGDFVARTGGDEFVIVMEGADGEAALAVANRIHAAVEEIEIEFERAEMRAGVSVGIAVTPGDAETPADLLHSADQAMYDAKFAGGQRTRLAGERAGNPGPRALRGRSIRLADTLTRTLVTGGTSEELAAVSLAQRWASAVVGRASLAPELLPQLRLVIASGASRRFQAPRGDRDQMLACYLVDRIEEDWVGIAEDQLGAQLLFLAGALLDIAWMTVPLSTGTAVPIETALARIAEAHPGAVGFPVWGAITGVVTEDAERRRAA